MTRIASIFCTGAVLVLYCCAVRADLPVNVDAAKNASYQCPAISSPNDRRREATRLGSETSDKNSLACAADFWYLMARDQPDDRDTQVAALQAILRYMDHILTLKHFDMIQLTWPEHDLRLQHAQKLSIELLQNVQVKWRDDPALQVLAAQIDIALAGPSDSKRIIKDVNALKMAVAKDPKVLKAAGQITIGRSLLDLPPVFGGGVTSAIPFLEQARNVAPDDPRPLRYLVEAYDEVGRDADARLALRALAQLPPQASDLQLFADEWRMGEGLAARLHEEELAKQLAGARAKLLHDHPNLLLRKVVAQWGHGGDDPISGEAQYKSEESRTRK